MHEWEDNRMTTSKLTNKAEGRPFSLTDADYVNHSCEPNAGLQGAATLVAMRDIEPGEEITYDYAMTDTSAYDQFTCRCGANNCRSGITGDDWRNPELRSRYRGYFSSYLEDLIREEQRDSADL
jgi:hypothetical protein